MDEEKKGGLENRGARPDFRIVPRDAPAVDFSQNDRARGV
jgi:hypothetical protein